MEENDILSVETLISNRTKKNASYNEAMSHEYSDFEYNIDEILNNRNWVNKNDINISLNNEYKINKNINDYINYFKNNNIEIKRILSYNNCNKNNNNTYKSNSIRSDKIISKTNKIYNLNDNHKNMSDKNKNKIKNINSI